MTLASLVVKLSANAAEFHREMENVARRVERTGRMIARAGHEISLAISLPLLAAGFAAFHALLQESARHFGPLSSAFNQLKADVHGAWLALGQELQPVFLQIINLLQVGIAHLRSWIAAFDRLPQGVKNAVIYTLAFLAALGPTVLIIGKVIGAIGGLIKILPLLASEAALAAGAVGLIAGAGIYTATHWDQVKELLLEDLGAIVQGFFLAAKATVLAIDVMTLGITELIGVSSKLRGKLDELEDKTLGKLGGLIFQANEKLKNLTKGFQNFRAPLQSVTDIVATYTEAMRQAAIRQQLFGAEFNWLGARASALEAEFNALIAAGPKAVAQWEQMHGPLADLALRIQETKDQANLYERALNLLGPTLQDHARLLAVAAARHINLKTITEQELLVLAAYPQMLATIGQAISGALIHTLEALGQRLGAIFAGMAHGFRGFGNTIIGIVGVMLETIGQALVAFGVAGIAIKSFISNPFAALAAGVALIALGSALANTAQNAVNTGGGGGGSAAVASVDTGAGSGGGDSVIILELHGDAVITTLFQDPRNQDALAGAMEDLSGRKVRVEPRSVG